MYRLLTLGAHAPEGYGSCPDKRLKTGRGPITFDTSTRAKLLIIV